MSIIRQLGLFVALSAVCVVCGGLTGPSHALAQQFRDPFSFKVHNNATAATMAINLKQIQDGSSGTTSYSSNGTGGTAAGLGALTQYNSTTIGNMTEITTILDQGAQGYVNLDTTQDGSNSSQSSSAEGTQISGGNTAIGGDIQNAEATTNNNSGTTETPTETPQ